MRVGCNVTRDGKNWSFPNPPAPASCIPAAGKIPVSSQNPAINTLYAGPTDLGCGGIEWLVEFKLPKKAEGDGWIIQQIQRSYDIRKKARLSRRRQPERGEDHLLGRRGRSRKRAVVTSNRHDTTADGRTYDDSFDQPKRRTCRERSRSLPLSSSTR